MNTIIQRVEFPDNRRILMLSDIHGHAEGLEKLLRQVHFSKDDILVIVGDLVEKGPESLRTVRMVMELCRTHTVYPLMGNVDLWRLEHLFSDDPAVHQAMISYSIKARGWWKNSFLHELCQELGVIPEEAEDTQALFARLREHFAAEFDFLLHLPTVLETQRMIFVHGGIPHERLDELKETERIPLMKWDHFYEDGLSFDKYVVVGHWPTTLYSKGMPMYNPLIDHNRHIICLDGGCGVKDEGQLNLLIYPDWRSDESELHTWTDLPVITALDAQNASTDFDYIRWGDHEVELLEQGTELSRISHHGRTMIVPAEFVWERDGRTYCSDITDLRLSVQPGDRLHLITTSPLGAFVKKDGVIGWYEGRYHSNA
ncbi:MAG: metallophosphoesterase [Clostridia bacterium]|nr:metallophosphoesterase [Clostridia bacterium]